MRQPSGQSGSPGAFPLFETECGVPGSSLKRPLPLVVETVLVTAGALGAVRAIDGRSVSGFQWLLVPGILVAAAMVPTWLANRPFPRIGLDRELLRSSLRPFCGTSVLVISVAFLGLWLITRLNLPIPLKPAIAAQDGWLSWLLYQFLYVAVAEEVFFRGYVQTNVMEVLGRMRRGSDATQRSATIIISAACFAIAHVVVQGRMVSLLTFLPGLVLAWLFVRTRSLLAPILLHALANIAYGVIALHLP